MEAEDGAVGSFAIHDLDVIDDPVPQPVAAEPGGGFYDALPTIEALAESQGVSPVLDIATLAGDFWPQDDSPEEFAAAIEQWRHAGTGA